MIEETRLDRNGVVYPDEMMPGYAEWELRSMGIVMDDIRTHVGGARSETPSETAAAECISLEEVLEEKKYFAEKRNA